MSATTRAPMKLYPLVVAWMLPWAQNHAASRLLDNWTQLRSLSWERSFSIAFAPVAEDQPFRMRRKPVACR